MITEPNIREVAMRRKFNIGNYETLDVELTATVGPGQNPGDILIALDKATLKYRKERDVIMGGNA